MKQLVIYIERKAFVFLDMPAAALPDKIIVACGVLRLGPVDRAAFAADKFAAEQCRIAVPRVPDLNVAGLGRDASLVITLSDIHDHPVSD